MSKILAGLLLKFALISACNPQKQVVRGLTGAQLRRTGRRCTPEWLSICFLHYGYYTYYTYPHSLSFRPLKTKLLVPQCTHIRRPTHLFSECAHVANKSLEPSVSKRIRVRAKVAAFKGQMPPGPASTANELIRERLQTRHFPFQTRAPAGAA